MHLFRRSLEDIRPFAKPRHDVILVTPALLEREQTQIAALSDSLAIALKARGEAELEALLAERTEMAAFALATTAWLDDPSPDLGARLNLAFTALTLMLAPAPA